MDYLKKDRRFEQWGIRLIAIVLIIIGIVVIKQGYVQQKLLHSETKRLDVHHLYATQKNLNSGKKANTTTNSNDTLLLQEDSYACEISNALMIYDQSNLYHYKYVEFLTRIPAKNKKGFLILAVHIDSPSSDNIEIINNMISEYNHSASMDSKFVIKGTGDVEKISLKEKKKIQKRIKETGLNGIQKYDVEYKLNYYGKWDNSEAGVKIDYVLGIFVLLWGILIILFASPKADLRRLYFELQSHGLSFDELREDLDKGKQFKKIIIGKKYALASSLGTHFINGEDLAWVYPYEQVHKIKLFHLITIHRFREYSIKYYTFSNELKTISLGLIKKDKFDEIIKEFIKIAPGVLFGQNKEWSKLIQNNPDIFFNMAAQSRLQAKCLNDPKFNYIDFF